MEMAFFAPIWGSGTGIFFSRQARRQLAAEITAQFAAFRATGLTLDHCNAHKHSISTLWSGVDAAIAGASACVRFAYRRASAGVLRKIERQTRMGAVAADGTFCDSASPAPSRRRLLAPDRLFGLRWSGQMTRERLSGLIRNLRTASARSIFIPPPGPSRGRTWLSHREEFDALMAAEIARRPCDSSLRLGGFFDFWIRRRHYIRPHLTAACPTGNLMP